MRHLILFFLFLVSTMVGHPVHAMSPTAGDRAYEDKNFTQALQSYQAEVRANPSSSAYYNLGNAHYRLKEYGKAVLAYRRSLRLDPDNADARHNLALVESNLAKAIPTTDNSLWQALLSRWIDTHSLAFWTYGIFIFLLLSFLGFGFWRLSLKIFVQKLGFSGFVIGILGGTFTTLSAYRALSLYNDASTAVVTTSSLSTSTTESGKGKHGPILHEGTIVRILAQPTQHTLQILLPNGVSAFCRDVGLSRIVENQQ